MTDTTLHLTIASVTENIFDGAATSVTVPGASGEMTILPHHEPLVSTLVAGRITIRIPNAENREFAVTSGVVETSGTRTVILV